jgi:hypothetical protein
VVRAVRAVPGLMRRPWLMAVPVVAVVPAVRAAPVVSVGSITAPDAVVPVAWAVRAVPRALRVGVLSGLWARPGPSMPVPVAPVTPVVPVVSVATVAEPVPAVRAVRGRRACWVPRVPGVRWV